MIKEQTIQYFRNTDYLRVGNDRQIAAHQALLASTPSTRGEVLSSFDPVLKGTIPIGIDVPGSDLDIICEVQDSDLFGEILKVEYGNLVDFSLSEKEMEGVDSILARFTFGEFKIEIFGQPVPVEKQNAFLHMLAEYEILNIKGEDFRQSIIDLKKVGYKTEPAFAKLLRLKGDPYIAVLNWNST